MILYCWECDIEQRKDRGIPWGHEHSYEPAIEVYPCDRCWRGVVVKFARYASHLTGRAVRMLERRDTPDCGYGEDIPF